MVLELNERMLAALRAACYDTIEARSTGYRPHWLAYLEHFLELTDEWHT